MDDVTLADIRVPTLVVHHREDGCAVTRYQDAVFLERALTNARSGLSSRSTAAIRPARIEASVVEAIARWIVAASTR